MDFLFLKVSTKHCSTLYQNSSITQSRVGKTNPNPALLQGEDLQRSKPHLNWQIPSTIKKKIQTNRENDTAVKAGNTRPRISLWLEPAQPLFPALPSNSSTQHPLPNLFYTMFWDIKLLNEVESTWNTSLMLIKAVINYAMVTRQPCREQGCASQMKGGLSGNPPVHQQILPLNGSKTNTVIDHPVN